MQALRNELDRMKRLFELKKWHSNTLGSWVYPREQTPRSLGRLMYALSEEYQELCRKKAQELKEEGFSATPVTKSPSCENKESLENVTAPSRDDLIEESLPEGAAAKEPFPSEVGDKDAEEPGEDAEEQGDREEEAEASTAWNNEDAQDDEGPFLTDKGFISDPFEANAQHDWPKVETNDGQLEPLALYEEKVYASGEGCPGYRVNVVKLMVLARQGSRSTLGRQWIHLV